MSMQVVSRLAPTFGNFTRNIFTCHDDKKLRVEQIMIPNFAELTCCSIIINFIIRLALKGVILLVRLGCINVV